MSETNINNNTQVNQLLSLVREMYETPSNDHRAYCTQELIKLEQHLSSTEIIEAGIGLLQMSGEKEPVQAYGAVLLKNAICTRRITPEQLPLSDLATWYRTEPRLRRLLLSDLINLLVNGAIYGSDSIVDGLINSLCSHVSVTREERSVVLLYQLVESFMEPEFNTIPRDKVSWLRRKVYEHGPLILQRTSEALYHYYVALNNTNNAIQSETSSPTQNGNNEIVNNNNIYNSSSNINTNTINGTNTINNAACNNSLKSSATSTSTSTSTSLLSSSEFSSSVNESQAWVSNINADRSIEACLNIFALLLPHMSLTVWNNIALINTMTTLLRWPRSQRPAIVTTASLLRSSSCFESVKYNDFNNNQRYNNNSSNNNNNNNNSPTSSGNRGANGLVKPTSANNADQEFILQQLFMVVMEVVPHCVQARDIGMLTEIIELLEEMPLSLLTSLNWATVMCGALLQVLHIPSVQFAMEVCSILVKCDKRVYEMINPRNLYGALRFHVIKDQCHPEKGNHVEGVALSLEQFGFVHMYESAFAEMRGQCGKLLERVAQIHPVETNHYIYELLSHLANPAGTAEDPRTNKHYVTHESTTYKDWEANEFMILHLAESFRATSEYVPVCIEELINHQPSDAVLLPLFFNMLSSLWKCNDDGSLNVWNGTIQILFSCMESNRWDDQDADESAARRRAHTLLVQLAVEHGTECSRFAMNVIKRIEPLLLRSSNVERTLLYEALVAFIASLPSSTESENYMRSIVHPLLSILAKSTAQLNQDKFNSMMVAQGGDERVLRDRIRDTLNVLAAILRRCRMTPYVIEMATQLAELLIQIVEWLHHMNPHSLPVGFEHILEMEGAERVQFLPGKSRQSSILAAQRENEMERRSQCEPQHYNPNNTDNNNNYNNYNNLMSAVRHARGAVISIRLSVYQLFGALSPLLPDNHFVPVLSSLHGALSLPLHAMRSLSERCLFVIAELHPLLLTEMLTLLTEFYSRRVELLQGAVNINNNNNNNDNSSNYSSNSNSNNNNYSHNQRQRRTLEEQDVIDCKQWLFYTKDVIAFLRKNVIDLNRWCWNAQLLRTMAQLVVQMLRSNSEMRGTLRFMMSLLELKCNEPINYNSNECSSIKDANGNDMKTALLETQLFVYSQLLQFVIQAEESILPPQERDNVAYIITEPYIRAFPTFSRALELIGLRKDEIDELHADLIIAGKIIMQRRRLKEFILHLRKRE